MTERQQITGAVFGGFENGIVRSRFKLNQIRSQRLPPGTALLLMIAASLSIWAAIVALFVHFIG